MLDQSNLTTKFFGDKTWLSIYYSFSALMLASLFLSFYFDDYYFLLIPAAILFIFISINDLKFVYLLMLFTIPLSIEVSLPNGFATDFPTELLIGGLMILFFPYILSNPKTLDVRFIKNPIITLLLIHYLWVWIATIYSSNTFVSLKFSLAKTWYLVTFVFVTGILIRNITDFKKAFWCLLLPLLFTIVYTLIRHGQTGFEFATVNTPMLPFFRNHVNYACTIAQMIPLTFLAISWYKKGTFKRRWLVFSLILMSVAVYFSYTRSAWLALLTAGLVIFVVRFKLMKWALIIAFTSVTAFFLYMAYDNNYLKHAPDFQTTVYHPELGDHLESTFEGNDISSAERIYRWVASVRMWKTHPVSGFGPGNFYNFYKEFTVNSFRTYVSDNPERSSVHNYFLLMLAEQGIIGLIIFVLLTAGLLMNAQRIYYETVKKEERQYVLAILLCIVIIYVNTFLSDLLETDKIGSFYFISIALLVNQDLRNKDLAKGTLPQLVN